VPQGTRPQPQPPQATAIAPRGAAVAAPAGVGGPQSPGPVAPAAASGVATTDALLSRAAPQLDLKLGSDKEKGLHLSGTVGVVVMMGLLTLLPTLLLMMTSFTRILIVLHFLKQALGTQSAPPAALVSALALLLTGVVMAPTLSEVNRDALTPWLDGKMEQVEMMKTAVGPFRAFMLRQTRDRDIEAFVDMSRAEPPKNPEDVSTVVLMSAFVTSELRTAFQLGFALFLPFIIIDVVVSSVLMSMGMFMLPPAMISLPFKLLLFVLVDGWTLVIQSLVAGFK
jgi:flagellar biosynthetic protein FliP